MCRRWPKYADKETSDDTLSATILSAMNQRGRRAGGLTVPRFASWRCQLTAPSRVGSLHCGKRGELEEPLLDQILPQVSDWLYESDERL